MHNDFKKYYDDGMSLLEQVDYQYGMADGQDGLEESMREAFMQECDELVGEGAAMDFILAKASFSKVAATLGLKNVYSDELRKRNRKYRFFKWATGIAAGIVMVLVCSLSWLMLNPKPETEWVEVSVPFGETSELVLADGTVIFMNSGTRVTYPTAFTGAERKIFVEGEILAEVAKNPEQPFIAHTENMNIRVLGTTFNLKAYKNSDCVEVFLIEGRVQCEINAENYKNSITMDPGNVVQYDRLSGKLNIMDANAGNVRSFKESGSIHFFNLTLNDIVKDLERRFNKEIIIVNEKLSQTRYFALFTNSESLDAILEKLNSDKTMEIYEISNKIYLK